jgi:hypothetical protein
VHYKQRRRRQKTYISNTKSELTKDERNTARQEAKKA